MAKGKYEEWLEPDGLLKLAAWARNGLTDEQIAINIGVAPKTLYDWKKKYGKICKALKKGKEFVDIEVENALLKKALGYNAKVKKNFKVKEIYYDEHGKRCEKEHLEAAEDEVHIPPDTTAQIFWLKNRKPDVWRDKKDIAVEGDIGMNLSNEQLDEEIEKLNGLLGIDESG